jgi:hypothetical protein
MVNFSSKDPFEILDLKATPDLDKKQIKRAYKRLALKYHPDVITNQSSTEEEKRKASDNFAKINWAYETLMGKNGAQQTTVGSTASSTSSRSSTYQPPHRRTGAYSNPNASTDWRDYMPKYDDDEYDTSGDSFEKIFSDLFTGVAGAAVGGGGGVFRDFVEFLERNVDGYASDSSDAELITLLRTGSLEEVGNEMDDTQLVVEQLSSKLNNLDKELIMIKADLKLSTKYMEKLEMEERIAEIEARKKVVQGYLEKARKRVISLQSRYKELIVGGENDRRVGRSSSSSYYSQDSSSYTSSASSPYTESTDDDGEAWKSQGFGSSGHRGSGRRRQSRRYTGRTPQSETPREPEPNYQSTSSSSSSNRSTSASGDSTVPPHRRTSVSSSGADDKRRLREIKVDEEFDKLKKDLGL